MLPFLGKKFLSTVFFFRVPQILMPPKFMFPKLNMLSSSISDSVGVSVVPSNAPPIAACMFWNRVY